MTRRAPVIGIYGASGRAGAMVAAHLASRGYALTLAGRRPDRISEVAALIGAASQAVGSGERSLSAFTEECRVVVNCAGPFVETAAPLARACIATGTHYLDISGERESVRGLCDLHRAAVAARALVIPAAGAKGALGAWALALAASTGEVGPFDVAYAHEASAYWTPSIAALRSVAGEGARWEAGRPAEYGPPPRRFDFPLPFAPGLAVHVSGVEEVALPGAPHVRAARAWLSAGPGTLGNEAWGRLHDPMFAPMTRRAAPLLWRRLVAGTPGERAPLPTPRRGALAVVVRPSARDACDSVAIVAPDGYEACVHVLGACVERLLLAHDDQVGGVLPVAARFPAEEVLPPLVRAGAIDVLKGGRSRRSSRGEAVR
ncbi:MAG TPA: saccharopine dehydrogenase NADP-binding domain-containing protein [Polyangiaceae bacterium]|nr:saccharopine dehydrogenase NADP-binding domain-containing protein [Polyangiaceae bacterium]